METLEDIKENLLVQTQQVTSHSQTHSKQTGQRDSSWGIPIFLSHIQNSQKSGSFKEEMSALQKKVKEVR